MIAVRDADGAIRPVAGIAVRDGAGVLRNVVSGSIRGADGLQREFFSSLAALGATALPDTVWGRINSGIDAAVQTQETTAAPGGGTAPFSYSWSRADADPANWTIASATAASTRFTATAVPPGETVSATFVCAIADANGNEVETNAVSAFAANAAHSGEGPLP